MNLESDLAAARARFAKPMGPERGRGSTPPLSAEGNMSTQADSVIVEIRAAEGGLDAKLLVLDQLKIYTRLCSRRSL
jgi:hypothetical protein